MTDSTEKSKGLKAFNDHRFDVAVVHLTAHLTQHPQDEEARLSLGLAQLFGGNEEGFLRTHAAVEAAQGAAESELMTISRSLVSRVTQAAAIVTMVAVPAWTGCGRSSEGGGGTAATTPPADSTAPSTVMAPEMAPPMLPAMQPPVAPPVNPDMATHGNTDVSMRPQLPVDMEPAMQMKPPVMKYPAKKYGIRPRPRIIRTKYGVSRPVLMRYGARPAPRIMAVEDL